MVYDNFQVFRESEAVPNKIPKFQINFIAVIKSLLALQRESKWYFLTSRAYDKPPLVLFSSIPPFASFHIHYRFHNLSLSLSLLTCLPWWNCVTDTDGFLMAFDRGIEERERLWVLNSLAPFSITTAKYSLSLTIFEGERDAWNQPFLSLPSFKSAGEYSSGEF